MLSTFLAQGNNILRLCNVRTSRPVHSLIARCAFFNVGFRFQVVAWEEGEIAVGIILNARLWQLRFFASENGDEDDGECRKS